MSDDAPTDTSPTRPAWLNEDWLATILGLTLLVLILVGAIPGEVVP